MGRDHRQRRKGAGIAQQGGAVPPKQRGVVQGQGVVVDQPPVPAHGAAVAKADAGRLLAHGQAAQHDHFQQQAAGVGGQIHLRVAAKRAAIEQDGFLRQPVKPAARAHGKPNLGPRRGRLGAIGALGRLGGRQHPGAGLQGHGKGQPVARGQPARGVQKGDLGQARGHARQHGLGGTRLRQIDKPSRAHDHIRSAGTALKTGGWGKGIEHALKGRRGPAKVNRASFGRCPVAAQGKADCQ